MKEFIAFIFFILGAAFFFLDIYTSIVNIAIKNTPIADYSFKFFVESLLMFMVFSYSRPQYNHG
jgi:predicted membrane channel-forming protein YqfA (hemolysin III family)